VSGEEDWLMTGSKSSQLKKLQELEAPTLTIRLTNIIPSRLVM
jgi:hypothetical protein